MNKQAGASNSEISLALAVEKALAAYMASLNGQDPTKLYAMVMQEVEYPLFKMVMQHTQGNQSQAAKMLGINRNTLRSRLETLDLL